jgi:hypothetical protein
MRTSVNNITDEHVGATGVHFAGDVLYMELNDGREIRVPMGRVSWMRWLVEATPAQREKWKVEPGGFAIYWEDLDDGIEIGRLLAMQPLK